MNPHTNYIYIIYVFSVLVVVITYTISMYTSLLEYWEESHVKGSPKFGELSATDSKVVHLLPCSF